MNLGKKLAEGYAVDTVDDTVDGEVVADIEPRTGPIAIVTVRDDDVRTDASATPVAQPVTA